MSNKMVTTEESVALNATGEDKLPVTGIARKASRRKTSAKNGEPRPPLPPAHIPLTPQQQKLVADNLGLIGVHMRHRVPTPRFPTRQREYDDLFQEGCLALMRAAQTYDPGRHGAFAAYALPRIRGAVHIAIHEHFATVRVPCRQAKESAAASAARGLTENPVQELTPELARELAVSDQPGRSGETIRHVLRRRFERAVKLAIAELHARTWRHRNPLPIMERIAAERLLIPGESGRTALRQIARDFNISSGRASAYENQLTAAVHTQLAADTQVAALIRMAKEDAHGFDAQLDWTQREVLLKTEVTGFEARFVRLSRTDRAEVIYSLIERTTQAADEVVRNLYRLAIGREDEATTAVA